MDARPTAGYSTNSLVKKLGIKEGGVILALAAPRDYASLLGQLPVGAKFAARVGPTIDLVHLFVVRKADLRRQLTALRSKLRSDAVVWVSWPKRAARVPTDITEDTIRDVALPLGFVDIKVCAVSEVWSGLKLVVRKALR
ncbi:MAG: DUF3052 domain-containing protein [Gemmatimonadota bacterium]|nr:DUF3052 domain-containing protein [Gemmatimonadota bacterium]